MAFSLTLRLVALCLLPLVTCEPVWTEDEYQTLKTLWDRCNFTPNDTRRNDILGICTRDISSSTHEDEALRGIKYLCSLFEKFSIDKCEEARDYEMVEITSFINILWSKTEDRKHYKLCDVGAEFRIMDSVMKVLGDKTCTLACSAHNAEKLCQLFVIFLLADYKHMEEAVNDLGITTTTETQTTVNDSVATTSSATLPYGQLAIYGISLILLCAIVFATYKYRHSILSCLRESQTLGSPGKGGKGGYRNFHNFEIVLPNLGDPEKAKSFKY